MLTAGSIEGLQHVTNKFVMECDRMRLKINDDKSTVMVGRKTQSEYIEGENERGGPRRGD